MKTQIIQSLNELPGDWFYAETGTPEHCAETLTKKLGREPEVMYYYPPMKTGYVKTNDEA